MYKKTIRFINSRIALLLGFAPILVAAVAYGASPVDVDQVDGIYSSESADKVEQQAVAHLKSGMKKLYGIDLVDTATADEASVIVVGRAAALRGKWVSEAELAALAPQGYIIRCGDGRIVIAGADSWGTLFGVYGFFQKLGVRFHESTLEQAHFPAMTSRLIEPFELTESPTFEYRSGWDLPRRQTHRMLGDPREGLNPELFDPKQTGSDLWIDHTAGYLVPKRLYYDDHPEYYAMDKDGKRISKEAFTDHRTPLCLSNPDVTTIAAERALGWIEKNPEQQFFFITYGDTGFWCQSPESLKLDPEPGQYATRLLHWVNGVAEIVAEKYPDKILMTFAYGGSDVPPPVARPAKNVWVVVATGAGSVRFWDPAHAQGQTGIEKVQKWIDIAPDRVLVCEYHGDYEPAMLEDTAGRLRYYKDIGLRGVVFSYGSAKNFSGLWQYIWGQLLWNPEQDPYELAGDYLRNTYGPAAEPLIRFFDLTRQQYHKAVADKEELVSLYPRNFYAPEFVQAAQACFEEAIDTASEDAEVRKTLQVEYGHFLHDVARHMPDYDLSTEANAQLLDLLDRARTMSKSTDRELEFLRETQKLAMKLEKQKAGYRNLIEQWLGASADMQPIQIDNGLRFTPQMFRGSDFGPDTFPGGVVKSHPDFPSPPKVCAGVFMKATGGRQNTTSSRMTVDFDLDAMPSGRQAVLMLEGQDAISHWMDERGLDWKTDIEILVNDKIIFSGECGFVRGNWSQRQFDVPAEHLKVGENRLEIHNISKRGWFAGCWFLLSDATLTFEPTNADHSSAMP